MSRTLINFFLDTFLAIVLMVLIWLTFTLQVAFPPPTAAAGWTLWGLSYNAWSRIQFGAFCVLVGGVLVHIILHWTWVCAVIAKQFFGKKPKTQDDGTLTLYGVGTLVVLFNLLGAALAAAYFAVQSPAP